MLLLLLHQMLIAIGKLKPQSLCLKSVQNGLWKVSVLQMFAAWLLELIVGDAL